MYLFCSTDSLRATIKSKSLPGSLEGRQFSKGTSLSLNFQPGHNSRLSPLFQNNLETFRTPYELEFKLVGSGVCLFQKVHTVFWQLSIDFLFLFCFQEKKKPFAVSVQTRLLSFPNFCKFAFFSNLQTKCSRKKY